MSWGNYDTDAEPTVEQARQLRAASATRRADRIARRDQARDRLRGHEGGKGFGYNG